MKITQIQLKNEKEESLLESFIAGIMLGIIIIIFCFFFLTIK